MPRSSTKHAEYVLSTAIPDIEIAQALHQEYNRCRKAMITSPDFHPKKKPQNYQILERIDAALTDVVIDSLTHIKSDKAFDSETYREIKSNLKAVRQDVLDLKRKHITENLMTAYLIAENIFDIATAGERPDNFYALQEEYKQRVEACKRAAQLYPRARPLHDKDAEILDETGRFLEAYEQALRNRKSRNFPQHAQLCNQFGDVKDKVEKLEKTKHVSRDIVVLVQNIQYEIGTARPGAFND